MNFLSSLGFLQSAFLFSLAALAIPVLLHLFSRWQTQKIELGTIRFLQEILTESTHRRRIRRWLLLMTRMLLLAVLAILFARPFFLEPTRRDGDRRRVILIDRSASMGMRGTNGKAIDVAVEKAIESANELGSDAKIDWAWFDSQVHPFQPKPGRLTNSFFTSGDPQLNQGHTSFAAALTWARDQLAEDNRAKSDVVLFTDLQRRGLGEAIDVQFPPDIPVRIVDVGRDAASNLAITRIELAVSPIPTPKSSFGISENRNGSDDSMGGTEKSSNDPISYNPAIQGSIRPDQTIYARVTFFNYGPLHREDVPIVVSVKQGAKVSRVKTTINAAPEQASETQIEMGRLEPGLWEMTVEADLDDDLLSDNRRIHAISVDSAPRVLICTDPISAPEETSGEFYLTKALRQGFQRNQARFQSKTGTMNEVSSMLDSASDWKTIVLTDATVVDSAFINLLEEYVRKGGHVLGFMGERGGEAGAKKWNDSPLAPGRLSSLRSAGVVPFRLNAIQRDHPILKPFDDPQTGDLQRLAFRRARAVELDQAAVQLASFDRELPGLVERSYGTGRVLWFMSDSGDAWSNWTNSPLYLPLIHQMIGDLAGLTGEGPIRFRFVGDERKLSSVPLSPEQQDVGLKQVKLGSKSDKLSKADGSDSNLKSWFEKGGFVVEENSLYVVNTLESESDTARLPESELRSAYSLLEPNELANGVAIKEKTSIKRHETWPWIAGLLLLALVFEFGLSNRTPP